MRPQQPAGICTAGLPAALEPEGRARQHLAGPSSAHEPARRRDATSSARGTGSGRSGDRPGTAGGILDQHAFRSLVQDPGIGVPAGPSPPPGAAATRGIDSEGVDLVSLACSGDGTHLAVLKVRAGSGDELGVSVVLTGGRVSVMVEAPGTAAAAWVETRMDRIREAVEACGVDLDRLDLGRERGSGAGSGDEGGAGGKGRGRRRNGGASG